MVDSKAKCFLTNDSFEMSKLGLRFMVDSTNDFSQTFQVRVSRLYRDLRLWSIGGGADEVTFLSVFVDNAGKRSKL